MLPNINYISDPLCPLVSGFNTILDDMGYSRDRTGLFDDLLSEFQDLRDPRDRSKVFQRRQITLENLLALYSSESYHLLDNGTESGDALMKYIDEIFNDLDLDDNGYLDRYEITVLLHKLTGKPPTEDQIFALFDVLDTDGSETIDREEFKFIVLKPNKNEDVAIPGELSIKNYFSNQTLMCLNLLRNEKTCTLL